MALESSIILLLLSGLETGRKDLAKSQNRCDKDVISIYKMFGRLTASGRVGSKSWNRKVGSVPRVGTDDSGRFLGLESKPDPKKSTRIVKTFN